LCSAALSMSALKRTSCKYQAKLIQKGQLDK